MVLKISYNPFFLEGSLKDKYQTMKMIFFLVYWGYSRHASRRTMPLVFCISEKIFALLVYLERAEIFGVRCSYGNK